MKVALLSIDNPYLNAIGGKHIHLLLLKRGLKHLEQDVDTYYYNLSKLEKMKILIGYPHYKLMSRAKRYLIKLSMRGQFFAKINLSEYDVVNAHDVLSAAYSSANKLVLTLHGYFARETINYGNFSDAETPTVMSECMRIERAALSKAHHVIAVDHRIRDYVVKEFGYPEEKVMVIHNAVDTDRFSPVTAEEKKVIRKKLRLPEDTFIVLIPRRFVKKNGVIHAAEALKLIEGDVLFIFAGRGLLLGELQNILKNDKRAIIFDGTLIHDRIVNYYKASDVVLIPSVPSDGIEEATSLAMLEGMATGKIVICTPIGGMKEVIREWENGVFVKPGSAENIAEKIAYIKENYDSLMYLGENARTYVIKNNSYIKHARKFLTVYEKVLEIGWRK